MANYYYESDYTSPDPDASGEVATIANWIGALVSFGLLVGLGVWGYQLLMRDVTGVPVVRAVEGPMRIAPEDPGGQQAEYQGLSVTRVAVEGASERPTERVILAPQPIDLDDEDQPIADLLATGDDEESAAPLALLPEASEPPSAIELAIAEALQSTAPIAEEAEAPLVPEPAVATGQAFEVIPASVAGVARAPRPPARPEGLEPMAVANAVSVSTGAVGLDIDPAAIPAGTRLVQLGAFPSEGDARTAWDQLDGRFGDFFEGKGRVVQEASAGGTTFYRLRAAGFEDLSDARRFCAVLVAENANCIPVIRR